MARSTVEPGITASIHISGSSTHAPELDDPDDIEVKHDDPNVVEFQSVRIISKYIEAVPGDTFSIKVGVAAPIIKNHTMKYTKVGFYITIDGQKLPWVPYCKRPELKKDHKDEWVEEVTGLMGKKGRSKWTERSFIFAKIETNDTVPALQALKRTADKMKPVGLIEVKVYSNDYGKKGGAVSADSKNFTSKAKIPEKALKGEVKDARTELGEEHSTASVENWRTNKKDGEDFPLAIFRFFYRTKRALQILDLIERTPSPEPEDRSHSPSVEINEQSDADSDDDTDADGLSAAERREVAALLRRLRGKNYGKGKAKGKVTKRSRRTGGKKIKKEKNDDAQRANKRRKGNSSQATELIVLDDDTENEGGDDQDGNQQLSLFMPKVPDENS